MRYRIGTDPQQAQAQPDGMTFGSAILGLFIAVVFVIAGIRARQFWMVFWGVGLILASSTYLIYSLL